MNSKTHTQLSIFSLEAVRVSHFQSLDSEKDLTIQEVTSCWNTVESLRHLCQHTSSGKMYQVSYPPTKEKTLEPSSKRWLNSGILLLGECWTANTSECHKDAEESFLSDVLEKQHVHSKFYLSQRACKGILRRAKKRGKTIPPKLKQALENSAQL